MHDLDYIDLDILYEAKKSDDGIKPENITKSDVFKSGIWELVDKFAILEERDLLSQNVDGSFKITKAGMNIFWNPESPLWLNLLKLLHIKPLSDFECSMYLEEPMPAVQQALEMIRKKGYVIMSPLRKDNKLLKIYEIMPDGMEKLQTNKRNNLLTVKPGYKLIIELNDEGILYEIVDDLTNPLKMIKTLSKDEIKQYK